MTDHAMMRAIQVHHYGGPDVLQVEQVPRPEPGEGEILVQVYAAGVLPMETAVRQGMFPGILPKAFPYVPGTAFAGVVAAVGAAVTRFRVGDAVCGRSPSGSYAEYTVVTVNPPAAQSDKLSYHLSQSVVPLARKPQNLTFDEAATLSGGATTAWNALFEDADIQPGQRVLIHAAAGGVGLFAVQFGRWIGADVIATASTGNVEFVRSLGASQVVDYTTTAFEDVVEPVDYVLDAIGGDATERSMRLLKPGGTLISVVGEPPADLAETLGIDARKNGVLPNSAQLEKIVELIEDGHVRPCIREVFSLEDAPRAHQQVETGHGRGRVILHIAD